jgi:hypothetical protein
MPPGFIHRRAEVFVPLQRKLDPATRGSHFLATYARLKDGVTLERATTEMRALGHVLAREFNHNHGIDVRSYYEVVVGNVRTSLRVLMGAVLLVLLIACANVANLMLASGLGRQREFAIRLALGAGPKDLARQLTVEGMLLAVAGGALGVLLALWAVRTFVFLAGNQLPRASTVAVDGRVLVFTTALARRRRLLWFVAAAAAAAASSRQPSGRRYADDERRWRALAAGSWWPRSRWRLRCSLARGCSSRTSCCSGTGTPASARSASSRSTSRWQARDTNRRSRSSGSTTICTTAWRRWAVWKASA